MQKRPDESGKGNDAGNTAQGTPRARFGRKGRGTGRRAHRRKAFAVAIGIVGGFMIGTFAIEMGRVAGQTKREAPLAMDDIASARPWKRYSDWTQVNWDKYNTLAKADASPPPPKSGAPKKIDQPITGDPAKGQKLVFDRRRGGGCLACHAMGQTTAAAQVGNVAPDL
ncbi:MAG: hypothetical protein KIT16_13605, partial [Rhodospirillaceae bacterium]|nr:hypothetical protein [Rhodospirillaceae bacterium]